MGEGFRRRRIFFIINPAAGGGKASAWWRRALPRLESEGLDFFWQFSAGGAQTAAQVRQAVRQQAANAIVAVGGDGHLHDTLNGMLEDDALLSPELALGVYPAGSGCDFARMIYLKHGDTSEDDLLTLLRQGQLCQVDVGRADFFDAAGCAKRAYFLNGSDIGLGAETCLRVNAEGGMLKRWIRHGQLAFMLAALRSVLGYRYQPLAVTADGQRLDGEYLIAAAGNGRFMGGKMRLFPEARLDDGLLDMLLVSRLSKPRVARLFAKVYDGTLLSVPEVQYRQVRELSLAPAQPMPIELDGELPGLTPLSVRLLPQALPLLCFEA